VKCKSLLVLTVIEKPPMKVKTKLIIGGSVAVGILAIILIAMPKPATVNVDLAVAEPTGGIFNADCSLTEEARKIGATEAELVKYGEAPGSGSKTTIMYAKDGDKCTAMASLSVYPGNSYEIYVAGKLAGDLSADEISVGSASKAVALQVTHTIKGQIVLSTHYSGCTSKELGTGCTASLSTPVRINVKDNFCYGQVSLADITQKGSAIKFYGNSSKLTATGKLGKGLPAIEDLKTGRATCTYDYTITDVVYDNAGYSVNVGSKNHSAGSADINALDSAGWTFDYEFKR
jgi:hypothetical protein